MYLYICGYISQIATRPNKICESFISKDSSVLKYCPDRYKTFGMSEKALDDSFPCSSLVCLT